MGRSNTYKTKQKDELNAYLRSMAKQHVTVNDIYDYFTSQGVEIGRTTIYRHLDALVSEGVVAKIKVDGIPSACYDYIGEVEEEHPAFYLKCEKCGKIVNFQCKELEKIEEHLAQDHGFTIDSYKTIFYGTCSSCGHKY